jgi:hypothetical protein
MTTPKSKVQSMPVGVVLARRPGVTRWATHSWQAHAVLPGAGPANWRVLREEDGVTEFHAATLPLTLHRADVEAYKVSLSMKQPSVFVVLRPSEDSGDAWDVYVQAVTASAYEAQDYLDSGNEQVEPVAMPEGLVAWVRDFVDAHFEEVPFVKRQRDRQRVDQSEEGIGDARVRQVADVYRAPGAAKPKGALE